MKTLFPRMVLSCLTSAAVLYAAVGTHAAPTDGFVQYSTGFYVQNRTSGCGGYSDLGGGHHRTWVCAGEERVEMRWDNWPTQTTDNQWQGDVMFDSATQKTCIMQIKSNTGGEPIYIQVTTPGTMRNDASTVFATGMANTWFRLNSIFNPVTGASSAYINGSLKVTRNYPTSARDWYFKNGTYNNGLPTGGKSTAEFRNITHWIKSSGGGITGFKRIVARHSGKDVVVEGASTADGANIFQYTYSSGTTRNDEWEIISVGSGYYRVMNRHSGKAMVVQSASTANGANVIQWTYGGSNTNDEWAIESVGSGYYRFVNRNSGKVLDVLNSGTGNGVNIQQDAWDSGQNQQFQLISIQ